MTIGLPPSRTATQDLLVPKSIPMAADFPCPRCTDFASSNTVGRLSTENDQFTEDFKHKCDGGYAASVHFFLFRLDAAWPRLGRAFRTAPVSRQTNPYPVWHSPRFHSRPATLLRPPFRPFTSVVLFFLAAALVKEKTSRHRQKGKNMKLEEVNLKTKEAVDYLVQSLESGQSAVLTQYLE